MQCQGRGVWKRQRIGVGYSYMSTAATKTIMDLKVRELGQTIADSIMRIIMDEGARTDHHKSENKDAGLNHHRFKGEDARTEHHGPKGEDVVLTRHNIPCTEARALPSAGF